MLAQHRGPQLRARWLAEGVVLCHGKKSGDLHLSDGAAHARIVDGEFSRCERFAVEGIVSDMNQNNQPTSESNIAAVQRLYAAFGSGDIDAVVAECADDVDWAAEASGTAVPWWGSFRGKGEVPRFFKEIGSNVDVTEFTLVSTMSNETDVIATIHWAYTVHATGKSASMYMQHWWRLADGKIVFFRGSEDTDQSARAFS